MSMMKAFAKKLLNAMSKDDHGFYVMGSGPVRVPNAQAHEIPKVIAEHHRDYAQRELQRALCGRR